MPSRQEMEEIDRIVDTVLNDDEKANALKHALHKSAENKANPEAQDDADLDDDLWDDVPV